MCLHIDKDVLGPQEATASRQFEKRDARVFGEPQHKYRRVSLPEVSQQDEQVQQLQVSFEFVISLHAEEKKTLPVLACIPRRPCCVVSLSMRI